MPRVNTLSASQLSALTPRPSASPTRLLHIWKVPGSICTLAGVRGGPWPAGSTTRSAPCAGDSVSRVRSRPLQALLTCPSRLPACTFPFCVCCCLLPHRPPPLLSPARVGVTVPRGGTGRRSALQPTWLWLPALLWLAGKETLALPFSMVGAPRVPQPAPSHPSHQVKLSVMVLLL